MREFEFIDAATLEAAAAALEEHAGAAMAVAGGTDVLGILKDRVHPSYPEVLVNLKTIEGLDYVREDGDEVVIGSLTRLHTLETDPLIRERYPALAEAARAVGSPQIRNMGTVGGNICQEPRCWYYRYPDDYFDCMRKGGRNCNALTGENRFHSLFGSAAVTAPPCSVACPGSVDIAPYMEELRAGRVEAAARILLEQNALPAITGRVCPHYCEQECNRDLWDEAVSVRAVERYLGDYALEHAETLLGASGGPGPDAPADLGAAEGAGAPTGSGVAEPAGASTPAGPGVAIVGAGPAGLACAFYLRRAGLPVTVFERMPEAGGMLRYAIPAYRLSADTVRRQVGALAQMGVSFRYGVEVGKDVGLDDLLTGHAAVFLAPGGWGQPRLGLDDEHLLASGLEFLREVKEGSAAPGSSGAPGSAAAPRSAEGPGSTSALDRAATPGSATAPDAAAGPVASAAPGSAATLNAAAPGSTAIPGSVRPGDKVVVIGGGNVAVDVALTAKRLGAGQVTMVCLEREDEMPALSFEVEQARAAGVAVHPSWGPARVLTSGGRLTGLELVRCVCVFDDKGAFSPVFDREVRESIEADRVFLAIGQRAELEAIDRDGRLRGGGSWIRADETTQATALPGVFAGGDVASGPSTVIAAIAAGRRAAFAILEHLGEKWDVGRWPGQGLGCGASQESAGGGGQGAAGVGRLKSFNGAFLERTPRATAPANPGAAEGAHTEDAATFGWEAVAHEADRCFNCGCVAVSPSDLATVIVALGARLKTTKRILEAGEFFSACPTGSTVLEPGELVEEVRLPRLSPGTGQAFRKFRLRNAIDFPIVNVATVVRTEAGRTAEARIAMGAVAPITLRAAGAETYLRGRGLSEETARGAADLAVSNVIPLGRNAYKVSVLRALVARALVASSTGQGEGP